MKALLAALMLISSVAFAKHIGDYNMVCEADYENYFVQTKNPVRVAIQPVAGHPEIFSDLVVIQDRVMRGRCLELCIDIPFYNDYSDKIGHNILSIRSKGGKELSATFTNQTGETVTAECSYL